MSINNIGGIGSPPTRRSAEGQGGSEPRAVNSRDSEKSVAGDSVSLTAAATRLQRLEAGLEELPVVDERKVAMARQAIADGTLTIDAERIAEKMLGFERELSR